jgi:hypothetical protein
MLNPHSYIEVMVPDASGKLIEWSIEYDPARTAFIASQKVRRAAKLLLEWPTGFHGWLESVDSLSGKTILPKVISRIDVALF